MPKNEIGEYDETDSGNDDISGIGLSDATLIDQLDNIARAQMGALKRWFKSSLFRLRDSTDQTKLLAFDLSGLTTATTRTVTMGDANVTLRPQAWELIGTKTASGGSNIEFTAISAFRHLRATIYLAPSVDNEVIYAQTSVAGNYDQGATDYNVQTLNSFSSTVNGGNGDALGLRVSPAIGNAANEATSAVMHVFEFNQAKQCHAICTAYSLDSSASPILSTFGSRRLGTTARDGIRFLANSGNITGVVTLEGIRS